MAVTLHCSRMVIVDIYMGWKVFGFSVWSTTVLKKFYKNEFLYISVAHISHNVGVSYKNQGNYKGWKFSIKVLTVLQSICQILLHNNIVEFLPLKSQRGPKYRKESWAGREVHMFMKEAGSLCKVNFQYLHKCTVF
jgi:hypothetical protein